MTPTVISALVARARQEEARVRWTARSVAVLLAVVHAWANRNFMNSDGVSYLDIGDAYVRADWAHAVNAYWGPLYSWLLGGVLAVLRPSPYWEFTVVHLVNLGIFVAALVSFEFLLREFLRWQASRDDDSLPLVPDWVWMVFGYTLFIWSSLSLITITIVSPDLLVAAFVYLATGLVLRVARGGRPLPAFASLGLVLALGYLAKAPMFPMAVFFVGLAATAAYVAAHRPPSHALTFGLVTIVVFGLLAGPYLTALSARKGRWTFGDSRFITYAWFVNGVPMRHLQEDPAGRYALAHPTRRVLESPGVFEFASPVSGTYPVWYDPSYWHEGIRPVFAIRDQARALVESAREYHTIFFGYLRVSLVIGFVMLWALAGRSGVKLRGLATRWILLAPAAAALGMYALVHAFPRYVAPFVVLLWMGLYSAVRLRDVPGVRRAAMRVVLVVSGALGSVVLIQSLPHGVVVAREILTETPVPHTQWEVARALSEGGLRPGDRIAEIHAEPGRASWTGMMSWARLARARIVAEVPPEHSGEFWNGSDTDKRRVLSAFTDAGARAVVAQTIPQGVDETGWRPLGQTGYAVMWLSGQTASTDRAITHPPR
jgi:hypothetical protein